MIYPTSIRMDESGPTGEAIDGLSHYVARQLDNNFPVTGADKDHGLIHPLVPKTLERLKPILQAVHAFKSDRFDLHHSLEYCTFLYLLANENFCVGGERSLSERLFCLNKLLSSIDLFYSINLPAVFFISHGIGSVLGDASYGNGLVVFQNVTVGRVGDARPTIGENVVLYPGSVISGRSIIGSNCVISAGVRIHNQTIPPHTVVKNANGELAFSKNERDYVSLYLSLDSGETE